MSQQASPTTLPPGAFWVTHELIAQVTGTSWMAGHILTIMARSKLFPSVTRAGRGTMNDRVSSHDLLEHADELLSRWRPGMGDYTHYQLKRLVEVVRQAEQGAPHPE